MLKHSEEAGKFKGSDFLDDERHNGTENASTHALPKPNEHVDFETCEIEENSKEKGGHVDEEQGLS